MTVDANDPRPPYLQVADDLRRKIQAGERYSPGQRLPSVRQLAQQYGIAPQTVQNALRELRNEGLVVAQQGRAFFVRDPERPVGGASEVEQLRERLERMEEQMRDVRSRLAALEGSS